MTIRPLTASTNAAAPPPPERAPEPEGVVDCVEWVARKVAGAVVGLVFGTSGMLVNAAAGGAEGALHGARVGSGKREALFTGLMTANLAAGSALGGGPVGAVLGMVGGHMIWRVQGAEVRDRVVRASDLWVDVVLDKLPGQPDQAGVPRRIANGLLGEAVGSVAGLVAGTIGLFEAGQQVGEGFVARAADRWRGRD